MGGSDKKASLWTKEGVRLTTIAERDDWVWCCAPRPNANYVAVGCNDGTICMYQVRARVRVRVRVRVRGLGLGFEG